MEYRLVAFKYKVLFYEVFRGSTIHLILGRLVKYPIDAEGPVNGARRSSVSSHILQASHIYRLKSDIIIM